MLFHLANIFRLFTDEEIQTIRNLKYRDVLIAVTSAEPTDLQKNVFLWTDGNNSAHLLCNFFYYKKSPYTEKSLPLSR